MLIFIIVLWIFYQFWRQFLWYFRTLFMYNFVHRFLIVFWSKKDAQNGPKITPKSTPVRPRAASGFLASSGHLWTRLFWDFWCQNGSQNDLKIYQSSPRWCPGSAKCRTFLQTVALGASFGRLGPQSIYCFASVQNSFSSFPKNWGGEGVGSTISKVTPFSITTFFSTKTSDWHGAALLCNVDSFCWLGTFWTRLINKISL